MNEKKEIILFWGLCLVIAFIIIWFLIIPLFETIGQISFELVDVKKELAIIHNKSGEVQDTESVCEKIDPNFQRMEDLFIDKDVPVKVIEFLEDVATISNLSIDISPTSLSDYEDDLWDFIGFRLNLSGPYVNFVKFLKKIETGPFLIELYDLSIGKISNNEESSRKDVNAVITIKIFAK